MLFLKRFFTFLCLVTLLCGSALGGIDDDLEGLVVRDSTLESFDVSGEPITLAILVGKLEEKVEVLESIDLGKVTRIEQKVLPPISLCSSFAGAYGSYQIFSNACSFFNRQIHNLAYRYLLDDPNDDSDWRLTRSQCFWTTVVVAGSPIVYFTVKYQDKVLFLGSRLAQTAVEKILRYGFDLKRDFDRRRFVQEVLPTKELLSKFVLIFNHMEKGSSYFSKKELQHLARMYGRLSSLSLLKAVEAHGASSEDFESVLPDDDAKCVICFFPLDCLSEELTGDPNEEEPMLLGGIVVRDCDPGHAFHRDCLRTWQLRNSSCPICRDIDSPEIHPLEELIKWPEDSEPVS